MGWVVVAVLVVIVWYWAKSKSRARPKPPVSVVASSPTITLTITTSGARVRGETAAPRDVGELTMGPNETWILNSKAPLPLTVFGADRQTAQALKNLLGAVEYWSQKVPEIALLIAKHNLRFAEVDAFVNHYRRLFDTEVARLIANSADWQQASEKDRADLRREIEGKALESLGVSVGRADINRLLLGQPTDFADDDDLLARFGGDASLYSFYLSQLSRSQPVVTVKADDHWRKSWEQLVDKGFARRGRDIPTSSLLEGLRLKDLNEILAGSIPKPLTRKAKAIEAALAFPDILDRLSSRISFRETFEATVSPSLGLTGLVNSFAYATAVATVVQQTYFTGVKTLDAIDEHKRDPDAYDVWEVTTWEDPVPACAAAVCKKYERLPTKRPPYHVGCVCQLERTFRQ